MNEKSDASRVVRNTFLLNASTIFTRGMGFVISIALARYLGVLGFGQYTFAIQFTGLFVILMDLGLNFTIVKEVARDNSSGQKYLGQSLIIRAIALIITFALIVSIANVMNYSPVVKTAIYLIGIYTFLKTFSVSFNAIFMAFERMGYIVLTDIFLSSITLLGVITCVYLKAEFITVLLVFPVVIIIYNLLGCGLTIKKFFWPDIHIDLQFCKHFIQVSFPFVMVSIFLTILMRVDTVMIKNISGDMATGYYGVSRNLISILLFIPANFNAVFYPVLSRFYKSDRDNLNKYYEKSFMIMAIIGLPAAVGFTLLADKIILLIYGNQFLPAILSLQILAWALAIQFLYSNVNILLLAADKQKTVGWITFLCMILNIILNFILIPQYSFVGASIATLATYCLLLSGFLIIASKDIYRIKVFRIIAKPAFCTLIMSIFVYFVKEYNLFVIISTSAIMYTALLFTIKAVTKKDLELIKSLYNKKLR